MTAVYSHFVFGDAALDEMAREAHATMAFTLLTALDLPWRPDGLQRDGPHVREPVDRLVRGFLAAWQSPWSLVAGQDDERTEAALRALGPTLVAWHQAAGAGGPGFSALLRAGAGSDRPVCLCEGCDDPECERRVRDLRRGPSPPTLVS